MGQQQLLLLVLGIVIVGLAVVAGINAFDENQTKSQKDAILNEGFRLATDIQAQGIKPAQMGGGGGELPASFDAAGIQTDTSGTNSGKYTTPWGVISYTKPTLTLEPKSSGETAEITVSLNESPELSQDWQ